MVYQSVYSVCKQNNYRLHDIQELKSETTTDIQDDDAKHDDSDLYTKNREFVSEYDTITELAYINDVNEDQKQSQQDMTPDELLSNYLTVTRLMKQYGDNRSELETHQSGLSVE